MLKKLCIPALCGWMALTGCDAGAALTSDVATPLSGDGQPERVAVVLNGADASLSLIPFADTLRTRTVRLSPPADASASASGGVGAVEADVRGERAVVAVGNAAALVDLRAGAVSWVGGLAPGAASSAAFVSDSLAVLLFPEAGRAVAVHPSRGGPRAVPGVGPAPAALRAFGGRVYVAGVDSAGGGMVAVLDAELRRVGSVALGGVDPRALAVRGGQLLVLNAGRAGRAEGSVSVVDTATLREVAVHPGFGERPASLAVSSTGVLFVGGPRLGVTMFDPTTRAFSRVAWPAVSPLSGVGNSTEAWRVVADPAGAVYMLAAGNCDRPGALVRVDQAGPAAAASTGVCPVDVDFAILPRR